MGTGAATADERSDGPLSVYYDGGCPLCRAEIDQYRRCAGAGQVAFVDVGRGATEPGLGPDLDRDRALRRFHVRTADGQLISGAAAFARLWRTLPGWRWLWARARCSRSPNWPPGCPCRCGRAWPG